jgi:hypothetical protein
MASISSLSNTAESIKLFNIVCNFLRLFSDVFIWFDLSCNDVISYLIDYKCVLKSVNTVSNSAIIPSAFVSSEPSCYNYSLTLI